MGNALAFASWIEGTIATSRDCKRMDVAITLGYTVGLGEVPMNKTAEQRISERNVATQLISHRIKRPASKLKASPLGCKQIKQVLRSRVRKLWTLRWYVLVSISFVP